MSKPDTESYFHQPSAGELGCREACKRLPATSDAQALPPGVITSGESSPSEGTPDAGERFQMVAVAGRVRTIAHPIPSVTTPGYAAITDYLNCTFPFETSIHELNRFFADFAKVAGAHFGIVHERGKGLNGYERSFDLGEDGAKFCCVGQRDTALLMLPGSACHTISDWTALASFLRDGRKARITRWDGAVDDFGGTHSVNEAIELYTSGAFTTGGNRPSCNQIGNWIDPDGSGRTFYVGKRKNGKMLRIYEKGKQLGNADSPWVRWELELHNVDRVVPWDVLTNPGKYVAGSYPKALGWVQDEMSRVATVQKEMQISYDRLVDCGATAYGPLVNVMMEVEGSAEKVVELLRRDAIPKRLQLPVLPDEVK